MVVPSLVLILDMPVRHTSFLPTVDLSQVFSLGKDLFRSKSLLVIAHEFDTSQQ